MADTEAAPAVTEPVEAETKADAEGAAENKEEKKRPLPGVRLHIKNLSETTTTDQLKELFASYGEVLKAEAKCEDDGKCKGFGFVILPSMEEAKKAQEEVNGKKHDDKELLVELVEPKPKTDKGKGKGKGKDGKGDAKGKGKGKDKGKGKPSINPNAAVTDPYGYYGGMQSPYAYQAQAMQMQMAQLQYMQYAQMAHMQAYAAASMAQMGGSPWPQGGKAGAPLATVPPPGAPPTIPAAVGDDKKESKGKGKGKGKGKARSEPKAEVSNVAPPPPDKDFVGTLKSISDKNGYGFIDCSDAYASYNRDTWVDSKMIPEGAKVGDKLKFGVTLSEKGHPRAQRVSLM
jgi:hypothetical protein